MPLRKRQSWKNNRGLDSRKWRRYLDPIGSVLATLLAPDLSSKDMLSTAIQAAVGCQIPSEYSCLKSPIFNTFKTTFSICPYILCAMLLSLLGLL